MSEETIASVKVEIPRHLVVVDCNVYLDAADLLLEPFTWDKFDECAIRVGRGEVAGRQADAIAAIALCSSGRFAGSELLEVWSSPHIDETVLHKAQESIVPDPTTGFRGLGWSYDAALDLVDGLINGLITSSGGSRTPDAYAEGEPPLDHEDGKVFGTCIWLGSHDPLAHIYCLTRDRGFIEAYELGELASHVRVLTPGRFSSLVRAARAAKAMPPAPSK